MTKQEMLELKDKLLADLVAVEQLIKDWDMRQFRTQSMERARQFVKTQAETAEELVRNSGGKEFTVPRISHGLTQRLGFRESHSAAARQVIHKLVKSGAIRTIKPGRGRRSGVYCYNGREH